MGDLLTEAFEDWPGAGEVLQAAASEDREAAVAGALLAAGDGGVDAGGVVSFCTAVEPAGGVEISRAHVDDQGVGREVVEQALFVPDGGADGIAIPQCEDDRVSGELLAELCRRPCGGGARGDQLRKRLRGPVPDGKGGPAREEVGGDRLTHQAKPDDADGLVGEWQHGY